MALSRRDVGTPGAFASVPASAPRSGIDPEIAPLSSTLARPMRTHRRSVVLLLSVLMGLLLGAGTAPASAHTELVAGTPGPGVTVDRAVGDLSLTFVSPLVAEGSHIVVRDPRGVDHAGATSTLGQQARVALEPMTRPGTYTVSYRAVATDGHPITGGYQFRVSDKGAAAARAAGQAGADRAETVPVSGTPTTAGPGGSSPAGLLIGGLGAGTLVILLLRGARRRTVPEVADHGAGPVSPVRDRT